MGEELGSELIEGESMGRGIEEVGVYPCSDAWIMGDRSVFEIREEL